MAKEKRTWRWRGHTWELYTSIETKENARATAKRLRRLGYKAEIEEIPARWAKDPFWARRKKYAVYRTTTKVGKQ